MPNLQNLQWYLLQGHVKSKHQEDLELPFKCTMCESAFILEEALHFHQKVKHNHQIETFECKECSRTFFCKASYLFHKTKLHGTELEESNNELYLCQFCCDAAYSVSELNGIFIYSCKKIVTCLCKKFLPLATVIFLPFGYLQSMFILKLWQKLRNIHCQS